VLASIDGKGLKRAMNREDLADFLVDEIAGSEWDGQSVILGYCGNGSRSLANVDNDIAPFQGKDLVVIRTPRAMPWADM
jgi:hypothetical protein